MDSVVRHSLSYACHFIRGATNSRDCLLLPQPTYELWLCTFFRGYESGETEWSEELGTTSVRYRK